MLLGKFDMIVSNPPYVPTEDLIGLDPSVRDYEPVWALDGGTDGLDFYRCISEKWKVVLKDKGCLMFECGQGQEKTSKPSCPVAAFPTYRFFQDTLGIDRVVAGILFTITEDKKWQRKKAPVESPSRADDKKRALETAISQIERSYGKGAIMRLGDNLSVNVDAISTGSPVS